MTLKLIAETAGCGYRTVKGQAKRLWPTVSWRNRRLTETEAQALMEALPKRNMVEGRGSSAPAHGQIRPSAGPSFDIAGLVRETVAATVRELAPALLAALRGADQARPAPAALPPPMELEPRDALRKIVDEWARTHGRDFRGAWGGLYREYSYRYHRDIVRAARNRGQSVLDYADAEDILGQLLALAYFLYGQKEALPCGA